MNRTKGLRGGEQHRHSFCQQIQFHIRSRAVERSFVRSLGCSSCAEQPAAAVPGNRIRASLGVRQESPSDYMSVCEEQHPSEQLAMVHGMLLVRRWELLLANGSASGMG